MEGRGEGGGKEGVRGEERKWRTFNQDKQSLTLVVVPLTSYVLVSHTHKHTARYFGIYSEQ